ncbi:MAG: MFS transporter, partial [Novosphingobium sp.]
AANGLFLLLGLGLSDQDFREWGWRVPFLASALLVGIGLWVRLRIGETPAFRAAQAREAPPAVPLARLLGHHSGAVLAGAAGVVACFAIFYLATAYALARGTGPLGYRRESFLAVQLAANLFLAVGIVASAVLSDRWGSRRVLLLGAAATVPLGLVFGPGLSAGSLLLVFVTIALALLVMGCVYGPLGSWLPTLFPVHVRYSGISVAFTGGGIVGGALAPIAAQMLSEAGGARQVGLLLSAAGLITFAGAWFAKPAGVAPAQPARSR